MSLSQIAGLLGLFFPALYAVAAAWSGAEAISKFRHDEFGLGLGFMVVVIVALKLCYNSIGRWRANAERWKGR
ncbi:MAG: hypothetical protein Q7R90_03200 [bacterium]|nr:hypothetical protein [bacterium]